MLRLFFVSPDVFPLSPDRVVIYCFMEQEVPTMDKLTMEDIGYFLYMQEMEQKQQQEQQAQADAEDDE